MGKHKVKPNYRRRLLRLPDLDHCKMAVLNSLGSPASRRVYEYAIDQFIAWYCSEPRLACNRIVVVRYRNIPGIKRSSREHYQPTTRSRAPPRTRGRRFRFAQSRISCGDQPSAGSQAAWVSLRQLVERRGEFKSTQVCVWKQHPSEARLRDAGLAVWVWFSQIGTCRIGVRRNPDAPGALGSGGPDWQGRTHSHRAHPTMGQSGTRSVDTGSQCCRGKDLSTGCQSGKGVGKRNLAECRVVRSQNLLRKSRAGAHCAA